MTSAPFESAADPHPGSAVDSRAASATASKSVAGSVVPSDLSAAPAVVGELVGERLELMEHLAGILATTGVDHGLVGPREVPRLWDRHIVNCALLAEAIPQGSRVVDVGSGAGLPGLVLAVARPDLRLDLIEPLERRVRWLNAAVAELGLDTVTIHRGKAQALWGSVSADIVTARAVARLGQLAQWCLPLVPVGGVLLAMKGGSAAQELAEDRAVVEAAGGGGLELLTFGEGLAEQPTRVVRVVRDREVAGDARPARSNRRTRAANTGGGHRPPGHGRRG